jgi:hypothetical protein
MILSAETLSPAQKEAIEQILGRQILEAEAISVRAFQPEVHASPEKHAATERLRTFLRAMKPSRTDVSEREFEAAELEAMRSVRPNYTPVS